ncbi:MAG: hypothetical protein RMK64_05005 [Rhodovarius sp.]|nr:hypothetical protein [Rhodovarius sp.]
MSAPPGLAMLARRVLHEAPNRPRLSDAGGRQAAGRMTEDAAGEAGA